MGRPATMGGRSSKPKPLKEAKLLVLGLDNAGKTTLMKKLAGEDINHIMPTQGFNIKSIKMAGKVQINMWDIGGQRSIRPYWKNYYQEVKGIVWVVDSTDRRRMGESE